MQTQTAIAPAVAQESPRPVLRGGIEPAKKASIAVLTPTLGPVHILWHMALLNMIWPMNTGKIIIPFIDRVGGQIGQVRNQLVKQILDYDENNREAIVTHVMWIDDDVIVNPSVMLALLSHNADIAAGVYFGKNDFDHPLMFPSASGGTLKFRPAESLEDPERCVEVYGWPQGLSLVKTEVYKRMRDELDLPKDEYGNPSWYRQPGFGVEQDGQVVTGGTEDFPFFENCSLLGYRAIVDQCKHAFGWHFSMAEKCAYPKLQWEMCLRKEPIVWPAKGDRKEVVWS
jgi:hypothetical protein